jgi:hypothetical protein
MGLLLHAANNLRRADGSKSSSPQRGAFNPAFVLADGGATAPSVSPKAAPQLLVSAAGLGARPKPMGPVPTLRKTPSKSALLSCE